MAAVKYAVDQGFDMLSKFYQKIEFRAEDFDESDDPTFKTEPVYKPLVIIKFKINILKQFICC